jgi:dolichol-phosphate mannosyltransferase
LFGLFRLAKTAIFSFSAAPLTLFYAIAAISGLVCASSIGYVLYHKAITGLAIPGWASTIITASFFGSLNALGISVLGEYVIRIYHQVRSRPLYLTQYTRNMQSLASTAAASDTVPTEVGRTPVEAQALELLEQIQQSYSTSSADIDNQPVG